MRQRAQLFSYVGLEQHDQTLVAHYELDDYRFIESVTFEGPVTLDSSAVRAVANLWYLVAGLSYYKAGAAYRIDLGATCVGPNGRALFEAALHDGLGEFRYRNELPLHDVTIEGGAAGEQLDGTFDTSRVLTPFGGGIDSVVTTHQLQGLVDQALFVVSPESGRFGPLEATGAVTGLEVVRATRSLDPQILSGDPALFTGHVPVTAMVSLLAAVAALGTGRGGVAMSNEHSSSAPNLRWMNRAINHQWSKSWVAEELLRDALNEILGPQFEFASYLRDRSELWVAKVFSELTSYHQVFRSCNRAFSQERTNRAIDWCGECDKCLFINLILAPFLSRPALKAIFHSEPLANPRLESQLRALVNVGLDHKPFECVGDPDESAVALERVSAMSEWSDVPHLAATARLVQSDRSFDQLLEPQEISRVPAHWLR